MNGHPKAAETHGLIWMINHPLLSFQSPFLHLLMISQLLVPQTNEVNGFSSLYSLSSIVTNTYTTLTHRHRCDNLRETLLPLKHCYKHIHNTDTFLAPIIVFTVVNVLVPVLCLVSVSVSVSMVHRFEALLQTYTQYRYIDTNHNLRKSYN